MEEYQTPAKALERIDYCRSNRTEDLDLSRCNLLSIPKEIKDLVWLRKLNLSVNKIIKIENLTTLVNLLELDLSVNQIEKVRGLYALVQLSKLNLSSNPLIKIEGLGTLINLLELDISKTSICENSIVKIEGLESLVNLLKLDLSYNQITRIEGLETLINLSKLNLSSNQILKIEGLATLVNLSELDLSNNEILRIEGLATLVNLSTLSLFYNIIKKIKGLESLVKLSELDLSHNRIIRIEGLETLHNLLRLFLLANNIIKIEGIDTLINLLSLNLSINQINRIEGISYMQLERLETIDLSFNPIEALPANSLNNVKAIKGYLKSKKEDRQVPNRFMKINIIGEGRIGKTQLFRYFNGEAYILNDEETHGTNTLFYQLPKSDYKVQIWDFGAQSYHHGFHQVFIRPKDFNLVLWANTNEEKPDYGYWLGTARNYSTESPLLLVQNVWSDTDNEEQKNDFVPHAIVYPDNRKLQIYKVDFSFIFTINIKFLHSKNPIWRIKHDYFLNSFHEKVIKYMQEIEMFSTVPQSWLFIKEVLEEKPFDNLFIIKETFKKTYANDLDEARFELLLYYLEFTGNVLYFHDNPNLREYIFPNPAQLSDWIYKEILTKEFKKSKNGVLDFDKLSQVIGEKKAEVLRNLMLSFHLLFEEKEDKNHLVIPQFLPEQNSTFKHYLLELIPYSFCLHFSDFIHEGRIFHFITIYGELAIDKTSYWRYGIIFNKYEVKTLVYYDKEARTIFVHIEDKKGGLEIAKEIFDFFVIKSITDEKYEVITFDADKHLEEYAKRQGIDKGDLLKRLEKTGIFRRNKVVSENLIEGAQLSTNNGINFIDIKATLRQNTENLNIGLCIKTKRAIKLDYLTINLLGMENHKLPKVFISYSRKDLEFKEELRTHLSILERYDLLKAWSCDEIRAGKWDKQIQTELEEADIIVYMVSANFISSEYIMEKEVKKGIRLAEENPDKKIMCVLVRECLWSSWESLEKKYEEVAGDKATFSDSMDLSQFQFLPYHQYKNQDGIATREEIVALEQWGRNQYEVRNVAFKQIASKILKEIK